MAGDELISTTGADAMLASRKTDRAWAHDVDQDNDPVNRDLTADRRVGWLGIQPCWP
jgi:hypothetical protein